MRIETILVDGPARTMFDSRGRGSRYIAAYTDKMRNISECWLYMETSVPMKPRWMQTIQTLKTPDVPMPNAYIDDSDRRTRTYSEVHEAATRWDAFKMYKSRDCFRV